MNTKLSLILFGTLVALAVLSAAENLEENSLTEEVASSRLARAADADPGKSKKKSKRKNKKASKKNKSKREGKKASKKGKSKRKNKKAEKKNKSKKKNKSEKKMKKASKKDQSKRKNKNSRKNKKNQKKTEKRTSKVREGRSTVPDTCVSTAVNALYNGLSKKASNFERQLKRIEARLPKIESKRGKMTEYNQTMQDLVAANSSCPAGNQTEIDALVATLGECESEISTACATPMINTTQIEECKPIVEGFVSEVEKCFMLNSATRPSLAPSPSSWPAPRPKLTSLPRLRPWPTTLPPLREPRLLWRPLLLPEGDKAEPLPPPALSS